MFTTTELLALDYDDLGELLLAAEGDGIEQRARSLGLDLSDPEQRSAVERAMHYHDGQLSWPTAAEPEPDEPEGPVIGAAQDHIRVNLMSDESAGHGPTGDGERDLAELTDALRGDLSGDEPALGSPDELAAALAESQATGRPFIAGTFAAYAMPDGGVVLVTEDPTGNVRRDVFPAKMVRLVLGLMAGKAPRGFGFLSRMMNRGE